MRSWLKRALALTAPYIGIFRDRRNLIGLGLWLVLIGGGYQLGHSVDLPLASQKSPNATSEYVNQLPTVSKAGTRAAAAAPPVAPPAAPPPVHYPNTYAFGNCTWYVANRRPVPPNWGNARSWLYAARAAGWATGNAPKPGAIAWTGIGWLGHVALVEQVDGGRVLISEMNYSGWNRVDQRWVWASAFSYIY